MNLKSSLHHKPENKKVKTVFSDFAALLEQRLTSEVFTTEDSVRYTFFYALLKNNFCQHTEVILEKTHPTISKAELDLFICASEEHPSAAFEFKFDRPIPSEKNAPRTQKAGAVFKDLFRLACVPAAEAQQRFFIYLTANEMADYFRNPQNQLQSFFELPEGKTYSLTPEFVKGLASTFQSVVGEWVTPCTVIGVYRRNLSHQFALRIYQVQN